MVKSACFAPDPPPGEISRQVIASWATDEEFKDLLRVEQQELIDYYTRGAEGVKELVAAAITNPEGPFPFLAVTQPAVGGQARIELLHTAKQYRRSRLQSRTEDLDLINTTYMFGGEIHNEEGALVLPTCYLFPEAVDAAFMPTATKVPKKDKLQQAFTTYLGAVGATGGGITELMLHNVESETKQLPKVIAIPSLLAPVFIHQPHPSEALAKLEEVLGMLEEAHRDDFDNIVHFLRAACVKVGGSSAATRNLSRMMTVWNHPPATSPTFRAWQRRTLKIVYDGAIPAGGGAPAAAAMPTFGPTFFEGLEKVINSGVC